MTAVDELTRRVTELVREQRREGLDAGWDAALDAVRSLLSRHDQMAAVALLDQAAAELDAARRRQDS